MRRLKRLTSAVLVALLPAQAALAGQVSWIGPAGASWGAGTAWSNRTGPGTGDTANFTDTGSINLPGEPTSVLDASRTIGGLNFSNSSSHFHTLDLGSFALTDTGNLTFNLDQGGATTTTIRNGSLTVAGPFANFSVARGVSGSSNSIVDFSGLSSFNASVQGFLVGTSTAGTANGTLTLSPLNQINAQLVQVGASNNSNDTGGTLHLGLNSTFQANQFDIGKNNSYGVVDIANHGTFNPRLPSPTDPAEYRRAKYKYQRHL